MNIFWQTPDGSSPPSGAVFGQIPFIKSEPTFFETINQVRVLPKIRKPYRVKKKTFLPNQSLWTESVLASQKKQKSKILKKVVLARCVELELEEKPDPLVVAAMLQKQAVNSTIFCLFDMDTAFVGATPETLFSRKNRILQTEALAGTALLNKSKKSFLNSKKNRSEILPVIEYIEEGLTPLCSYPISISPISIKQTSNLMHLHASIEGQLRPKITDLDVLSSLHPTPALCGLPKTEAFDLIQKLEPFDRGLFGGTLGWMTEEESHWIVAIRCCEIRKKNVKLFTGAGIVPLSNPENEWEELENKMALFKDIFV